MIYPIVAYGDPILKKRAADIEKESIDVKKLSEDMFETMYNSHGVGLAAPQIGMSIRMFIADGAPMDEKLADFRNTFINPTIIDESDEEWSYEEGCLSIPGVRSDVIRPEKITLHYFDTDWKEHTEEYDGLAARIIQHEYDHLEGILFLDYISGLRRNLLKGKLSNISKGKVDVDYKMKFPIRK